MNRTDRLMGILLELQAHRERRAEDLARTFEVSVRTIYRDVEALCETGVPIIATPGKGYRLMEGYFLPPLSFTGAEAALLALGGEYVRTRVDAGLQRDAASALAKLASVLPAEQRATVARWQQELLFSPFGDRPGQPSQAALRAAVQERRVVRLLYHAYLRAAPEQRDVEPISLVFVSGAWHLWAYCRLRRAPRYFRLERIDRMEVLDERFERGERHAARRAGSAGKEGFPEARVRFDPDVERWVRERQPYLFLREEPGPVFVYALRDVRELLGWLLAWGAAVEVLSPAHLRVRLADEARAILARHNASGDANRFSDGVAAADRMVSGVLP